MQLILDELSLSNSKHRYMLDANVGLLLILIINAVLSSSFFVNSFFNYPNRTFFTMVLCLRVFPFYSRFTNSVDLLIIS